MSWDMGITLLSLAVGAWFLAGEPLLRWLRTYLAARRLPHPRYAPPPVSEPVSEEEEENEPDSNTSLLYEMMTGTRYQSREPAGTSGNQREPAGTSTTGDTAADDERITDLVRRGYSANQVVSIVGGKRSDVLARVRKAKRQLGIAK